MHRVRCQLQHLDGNSVFDKAAHQVEKHEKLPRWLSQTLAVLMLLVISGLFFNGGALLVANFMHVLIGKVDMPPSVVYSTASVIQATSPKKATGENPVNASSSSTPIAPNAAMGHHPISSYVLVPRPTFASAMDKLLIRMHNPADGYIQSDAVDVGVLIQQTLHQMLSSVFADATRTNPGQTQVPPGIPLNQGQ